VRLYGGHYWLIGKINGGLFLVKVLVDFVLLHTYLLRTNSTSSMSNNSSPSLREVYITGGLAPMVSSPDEVYMRLFRIPHTILSLTI